MKTMIVGDLHGNKEIAQMALDQQYAEKVIFIGDYLDSFGRSRESQIETLDIVLRAAAGDDNIIALRGNHENSYLIDGEECSGWSLETQKIIDADYREAMENVLQFYCWEQDHLITHAGVSNTYLTLADQTLEEYLEVGEFLQVGRARGGKHSVGGMMWCDWRNEFEPIRGVSQIVGHTHYPWRGALKAKIGTKSQNYNIDCLPQLENFDPDHHEVMVVVIENGLVATKNLLEYV